MAPLGQLQNQREAGTAVTELVLCIPILLLTALVLYTLNEFCEDEHVSQIALRNAAMIADSDDHSRRESIQKDQKILEPIVNPKKKLTKEGTEVSPYQWNIQTERRDRNQADQKLAQMVFDGDSSSSYRTAQQITSKTIAIGTTLTQLLRSVGRFGQKGGLFLPHQTDHHVLTLNTESEGQFWSRSMKILWSFVHQFVSPDQLQVTQQQFVIQNAGYHPSEYQNQGVLGALLGSFGEKKHWSSPSKRTTGESLSLASFNLPYGQKMPDGFVARCMMNFSANSFCYYKPFNWFYATTQLMGIVKGIIQLIAEIVTQGGAKVENMELRMMMEEGISQATDVMAEQAQTALMERAGEELQRVVHEGLDQLLEKASTQAMEALDSFSAKTFSVPENEEVMPP